MNSQQWDAAAQENDQGSLQWTCWSELQSQHSLPSEQKDFMQRVYKEFMQQYLCRNKGD